MSRRVTKLFNIDIKSVDEEKRQIDFCFSDDGEDRQGEVVDQATWDTKNYMLNPIIAWGHFPENIPENVLGQGVKLDLNNAGKSYVTAQFDDATINPRADMVFKQLVKRTLRCVSAGFINHTFEIEEDTVVLKDNELVEISIVPIPANPRAVALALDEGSLSEKDAKWLLKSMQAESELIEKRLKKATKEKSMTEEQAKALTEAVAALSKTVEEKFEAVDERLTALTPAEETEDEKKAREAKEAEEKDAAEKKAKEEEDAKAEEERLAKEAEDKKNAGPNDDDEVTPEMQAEIDAALEAQIAAEAEE